ncbi:hypothetical protein EXW38_11555 [Bacillus mycoides]|uniref:phage tail spike protein n=1 Tax=Bacillus mycoides TaxID=1405 RepID=UPI001C00D55D|nr:phage tail spike protein [Bacillus mycoides]QWH11961.1 hypothetical protein EXW38_11555 [Bacillus mycoides]
MSLIKLYNKKLQHKAYLENAFKISYEQQFNAIWTAAFSLPLDDPKNAEIIALDFLEIFDQDKRIGMFRIIPKQTVKNENNRTITYKCEHVLATLLSDVLFRYHQLSNYTTKEVLEYLLRQQEIKHWRLGKCDFVRYFHYSWEHENTILGPIFSVPKPFDEQYAWTWDDSIENYPWTLNLERASNEITGELRHRKNLKGITRVDDPLGIITRIYPMGYGEGINQLDITKVNPTGKPYIEAPAHIIEKYGIEKEIWVDRRFENPEVLFNSAQADLNKKCRPKVTYSVDAIDYELIDPYKIEKYEVGKLVRITDEDFGEIDVRLIKKGKSDVTGNPLDMSLEIGDPLEDLGTTQADLERRQKINEVYSQGSTNILNYSYNDNCDSENPAVVKFYLPDDLVNINTLDLTFETEEFRAYSGVTEDGGATVESTGGGGAIVASTGAGGGTIQSTGGGGATVQSTGGGGATVGTSSSGGGVSKSTESGGNSTQTSTNGGGGAYTSESANPTFFIYSSTQLPLTEVTFENHYHAVEVKNNELSHSHRVNVPSHSHSVLIPSHSHNFSVPAHDHQITLKDHTHQIVLNDHVHQIVLNDHVHQIELKDHTHKLVLPNHTHEIKHGIYKLSEKPSKVLIKVDGNEVPINSTSVENVNLIPYLSKDGGGKIERGKWHEITITPDKLGRVNANVISRLFIQSRTGGTF